MVIKYKDKNIKLRDEIAEAYKKHFTDLDEKVINYTIITGNLNVNSPNLNEEIENLLIEEMEAYHIVADVFKEKGII